MAFYVDDYSDAVCIESKTRCVTNFTFLTITDVDGKMADFDGYIGLAPDDPNNGPSFIAELYNQNVIDEKLVTIDLNSPGTSKITIGNLDSALIDQQILYYKSDQSQWKLELWDFKIGS